MDKFILVLILSGILAGQLFTLPILGIAIPLIDIAMLIALVALATRTPSLDFTSRPLRWFLGLVGVFLLSLLVNLSNFPLSTILEAGAYLARFATYGGVAFLLIPHLKTINHGFYLSAFGLMFMVFAAIGFLQLGFFPNLELLSHLGWDPHLFRLLGSFLDPNFASVLLTFGSLLALLVVMEIGVQYWPWLIALLLSFSALIATQSRTGLLALAASGVVLVALIRHRWALVFLVVLVATAALLPSISSRLAEAFSGDSFQYRVASWQEGWELTLAHPLLGVGYNTLPTVRETTAFNQEMVGGNAISGFDSSLLTIAATSGLIGLTVFLLFVLSIFLHLKKTIWAPHHLFSRWFGVSTVALGVASIFINAWLYAPLLACWFVMMSLSFSETNR